LWGEGEGNEVIWEGGQEESYIVRAYLIQSYTLRTGPLSYIYILPGKLQSERYTYIGATKGIGVALFATILGHLKKTFSTFSFRIIYFRMFRIIIFKKCWKKFFVPLF
jgi:hypothetical protein